MQSSLEYLLVYFPSCNISPTRDALVNKISLSFAQKDSQRLSMLAVKDSTCQSGLCLLGIGRQLSRFSSLTVLLHTQESENVIGPVVIHPEDIECATEVMLPCLSWLQQQRLDDLNL